MRPATIGPEASLEPTVPRATQPNTPPCHPAPTRSSKWTKPRFSRTAAVAVEAPRPALPHDGQRRQPNSVLAPRVRQSCPSDTSSLLAVPPRPVHRIETASQSWPSCSRNADGIWRDPAEERGAPSGIAVLTRRHLRALVNLRRHRSLELPDYLHRPIRPMTDMPRGPEADADSVLR